MNSNSRRQLPYIAVPILALVGAAAWLVAGHSHAGPTSSAPSAATGGRPALAVRTTLLQGDKWARMLEANGSIVPWQEAVISAQVQGLRIADVKVSIGDRVQQGQVLATLDNLVHAAGDPPRAVQGRIVAPDSGIISAADATVGTFPQPGMALFRLIRKGRLEWHADLTADELMLLHRGMAAQVTVGEDREIRGTVRAVSPVVDPRTRLGYALISLPDSEGVVAGAYASGVFDISGGKRTVQTLPQTAVMQRGSETYVLVVAKDGRVHERPVKIGQRRGNRVQIRGGLQPDEPVVEGGGAFLTEGDVVQVVKN
jgi:multidrug efflux pump subunit AcrA (membrane-fusion protein)